ncbi:MAG: hypothetical protein ACJ8G3_13515 [Burkholderiaceae bacterium]
MDYHQSAKPGKATPNRLDTRRRHKLRHHAASLATGVIMFVVSFSLMQAFKPPATTATATTAAVSSSAQSAPQVSQVPPLSSSGGSSGTGATSAGAEERQPAPARASERAVPAPGSTIAAQIIGMPSVYIHVLNENARDKARLLAPELNKKGIALAGIKIVSDGPRSSDLRYFRPPEKEEAMQVQAALLSLGLPARRLKRISGFETSAVPRQYELWLSADYPN